MTTKYSLTVLLFFLISLFAEAQNHLYDWGTSINSSIYSFSAVRNKTYSSPYEYNLGTSAAFSRYINNNFDVSAEFGRSKTLAYPTVYYESPLRIWEYERMNFYDAQFTLKYKLNNGYIIPEDFIAGPFFKVGFGANKADILQSPEYFVPIGIGTSIRMGKHLSFNYQSTFKAAIQTPKSYMQHSIGFSFHFGKTSRKRMLAMKERAKEKRAATIARYRKKKTEERAKKAKERLANLEKKQKETEDEHTTIAKNTETETKVEQTTVAVAPAPVTKPITVEKPMLSEEVKRRRALGDESDREEIVVRPGMARAKLVETHESLPPMPKMKPRVQVGETPNSIAENETENPQTNEQEAEQSQTTEEAIEKPVVAVAEPVKEEPVEIEMTSTLVEEETELPVEVPQIAITETSKAFCKVSDEKLTKIGEKITFDSDRYRVRSRTFKHLAEVINIMEECDDVSYVIIAHTDADGDARYNKRLSQNRAKAIKKFLVENGVPSSRLITAAYGEALVLAEDDKEKNRRVSFKINHQIQKDVTSNN